MNTTNKFLALALMAVAMVFASCSKEKKDEPVVPTTDYSKDILGMWEGVSMTGDVTYGDEEARILYQADGTYCYYRNYAGVWVLSDNESSEYTIDGNRLAMRWKTNGSQDFISESWDISYIRGGNMRWAAFRERTDGSRFTATFNWKKVDVPTDDKLLEKAMGDWTNIGTTFTLFKDGEIVGIEERYATSEQTYSFFNGNKMRLIQLDDDGNPEVIFSGTCTAKGTKIIVVYEESIYPTIIGIEDDFDVATLNDEFLEFGFYHEGEAYIKGEDTPEHDHYLQHSRYKRK